MQDLNQKQRRQEFRERYQKDCTLLISILVSAVLITVGIFALARALDLWAVNTCEHFNDCEAVFLHLNK